LSDLGLTRHLARERALEIFYEATIKERSVLTVLSELPVQPDGYTILILTSAAAHQESANELISRYSIDWPLERLAVVDRLVMTMAIGEMLMDDPPPVAVILDEAVELAKVYSTEGSASFVNGVLAACAEHLNL
jgi:N utilization substance protein B